MSMIKIENLTFSYPTSYDNVFENVSFQVDTDWKLGFVGRNGRGKTTFLNLLLGKYEYSGKILSSVQFDYFPYPVSDKNRITEDILQEICPLAEEWELMRELSYLDVDVDVLWMLQDAVWMQMVESIFVSRVCAGLPTLIQKNVMKKCCCLSTMKWKSIRRMKILTR